MKQPIFRGTCTALVTPFSETGIDWAALDRMLETQLEAGVEALVICGTTGEAVTLESAETLALLAHCVRFCGGKTKLIAGTGGNDTRKAADTARSAEALGADGLLCVTPYYNRCTQDGLLAHYEAISRASALPMLFYNVPARTNVRIEPEAPRGLWRRFSRLLRLRRPDPALYGLRGPGCDLRPVQSAAESSEGFDRGSPPGRIRQSPKPPAGTAASDRGVIRRGEPHTHQSGPGSVRSGLRPLPPSAERRGTRSDRKAEGIDQNSVKTALQIHNSPI